MRFSRLPDPSRFWIILAFLAAINVPVYTTPKTGTGRVVALTVAPDLLMERAVPERKDPKVLVLLYHNLVYGRTGSEYHRDIYNFEHDLAFLRRNFRILGMDQLHDVLSGALALTTDAAIITFDDGDLSMYMIAYPLLREYSIKASFFLVSDFVGEVGYINWDQTREMNACVDARGEKLFTFGSHTKSHTYLGELGVVDLRSELVESKRKIESELGSSVDILALPFNSGSGRTDIRRAAVEAGYTIVRSSDPGMVKAQAIRPLQVNAFNVDNQSTDKLVQNVLRLGGR